MKPRLLKAHLAKASDPKTPSRVARPAPEKSLRVSSAPSQGVPDPAPCRFCPTKRGPAAHPPEVPTSTKSRFKDIHDQSTVPGVTKATLASLSDNSKVSQDGPDPARPTHLQKLSTRLLRRTILGCREYYAHVIDNMLEQKRGKDLVDYHETVCPAEATLLSRFYKAYEFPAKLQVIHKFCKFVFVFPKLYNLDSFPTVRRYFHLRRRKREKTMRKILEEIDDSNMNLLSLDYVVFCETTCLPIDLRQFAKTRIAFSKASKLGSQCLGLAESTQQLCELRGTVEPSPNYFGLPFDTEESTILLGQGMQKEPSSFVDAAVLMDKPEARQGRVPVKMSFNIRKSELKLPFNVKKPLKSVYSSYRTKEGESRKPPPGARPAKGVVYQRRENPRDAYRTNSDNQTGNLSGSKRQIRLPEYFGISSTKSSSHREIMVTPGKFALGTNKLITASARTIPVKKPQGITLTPIGETEPEAVPSQTHPRSHPLTTSEPFRGLNGSFKQSAAIAPYLHHDAAHGSGLAGRTTRFPSEKSMKVSTSLRRPALNKKSIEEYQETDARSPNPATSPTSSPDAASKSGNAIGPFHIYPVAIDKAPGAGEHVKAATQMVSQAVRTRPLAAGPPVATKPIRDFHRFGLKSLAKPAPDSKLRSLLREGQQTKAGARNGSVKSGQRFMSSTFQLIAPGASGSLSKQSFAGKGEVRTFTNLADAEVERNSKQVSREASRGDGRSDYAAWTTRLRLQRGQGALNHF